MRFEERKNRFLKFARGTDDVNNLEGIYSQDDEDFFLESVSRLITGKPRLWKEKGSGRAICYSAYASKLLLAYLLAEIKEGNLLSADFLDSVRKMEVDVWKDFINDDCGYKTAAVLSRIVEAVITEKGFFEMDTISLKTEDLYSDESADEEFAESMKQLIKDACPDITDDDLSYTEIENGLDFLGWCVKYIEFFSTELYVVKSKILWHIEEKEKSNPTRLGREILKESRIFLHYLQEDTCTLDMGIEKSNGEKEEKSYYGFTSDLVIGDGTYYPIWTMGRYHKFWYSFIFEISELIKKIEEYLNSEKAGILL